MLAAVRRELLAAARPGLFSRNVALPVKNLRDKRIEMWC